MQENRQPETRCRKINIFFLAVSVSIFIFFQSVQLDANVYSWTDRNGVKHFSNVPPPPDMNASINVEQELAYDRAEDEQQWELEKEEWEELTEDLEETETQQKAEQQRAENTENSQSMAEKIKMEKFRLETEMRRLEKKPAASFAKNLDGKRASIAFYQSRLQELRNDPEAYFNKY